MGEVARVAAVIPTLYRPKYLDPLVKVLEDDGVGVFVLDSNDYGHKIHRMWNDGVRMAREVGATEIAVLNDDIEILPGTIGLMVAVLRAEEVLGIVYPDQSAPLSSGLPDKLAVQITEGSARVGGMTGFAFMFKSEVDIPFDESYNWWFGDDTFEEAVRASGRLVGRIIGLPVGHDQSFSANNRMDELDPLIRADWQQWFRRHNR